GSTKLSKPFCKILYLGTGQSYAAVRCEASKFCRSFAPVYQRRQADRNLDRAKRIHFVAGLDFLSHFHLAAGRFNPRFIGRSPRRIEDDRVSFAQALRKRELGIAYADL